VQKGGLYVYMWFLKGIFLGIVVAALGCGVLLAFAVPPWMLVVIEALLLVCLGVSLLCVPKRK